MLKLTSRKKSSRTRNTAALVLAGAACAFFFGASADPALALCKYNTPHCAKVGNPGILAPSGGNKLPDGPPGATVDCELFGDCNGITGADGGPMFPARVAPPTGPQKPTAPKHVNVAPGIQ